MFLYVLLSLFVLKKVESSQENDRLASLEAVDAAEGCRFADLPEVSEISTCFFSSLRFHRVETSFISYGSIIIKHHVLRSQVGTLWPVSAAVRPRVAAQRRRCSSQFVSVL